MELNGTWGTDLEISALATLFQIFFSVLTFLNSMAPWQRFEPALYLQENPTLPIPSILLIYLKSLWRNFTKKLLSLQFSPPPPPPLPTPPPSATSTAAAVTTPEIKPILQFSFNSFKFL